MTPEQRKEYERLQGLHAARKLKKSQAVLLASLQRMAEQEAFNDRLTARLNADNVTVHVGDVECVPHVAELDHRAIVAEWEHCKFCGRTVVDPCETPPVDICEKGFERFTLERYRK